MRCVRVSLRGGCLCVTVCMYYVCVCVLVCVECYLKRNGLRILISLHDERNQQRTMRLIFIDTQHKAKQQQRVREAAKQRVVPKMITGNH